MLASSVRKRAVLPTAFLSLIAACGVLISCSSSARAQWVAAMTVTTDQKPYLSSGYTGIPSVVGSGSAGGSVGGTQPRARAISHGTASANIPYTAVSTGFKANCTQEFDYTGAGTVPALSVNVSGYAQIVGYGGQGTSAQINDSPSGSCGATYGIAHLIPHTVVLQRAGGGRVATSGSTVTATADGRATYPGLSSFDATSTELITYSVQ